MAQYVSETVSSSSWSRVGGVCGLLGIASYLVAAFVPLPDTLSYTAAFAFGPLLAVGLMGLYHCMAERRPGPLLQIAAAFGVAAGFTVLIMITAQQAIFSTLAKMEKGEKGSAANVAYQQLADGLDSVQLGIDVAWDVAISVAVVLFAIGMWRDRRFGRILGGLGAVFGLLLLGYNLWYFPTPPISSGSIDWGPAVALWLLATFVFLLRAGKADAAGRPLPVSATA
jgi:hypothetical protein